MLGPNLALDSIVLVRFGFAHWLVNGASLGAWRVVNIREVPRKVPGYLLRRWLTHARGEASSLAPGSLAEKYFGLA